MRRLLRIDEAKAQIQILHLQTQRQSETHRRRQAVRKPRMRRQTDQPRGLRTFLGLPPTGPGATRLSLRLLRHPLRDVGRRPPQQTHLHRLLPRRSQRQEEDALRLLQGRPQKQAHRSSRNPSFRSGRIGSSRSSVKMLEHNNIFIE